MVVRWKVWSRARRTAGVASMDEGDASMVRPLAGRMYMGGCGKVSEAGPQQLEKSTILEAVWIDKDTFQFSAVAWYTVGHRQPLHSLFGKHGDLFLDHGDLTACENILSRFSNCSLRPLSCSADMPSLRLSKQVLRPSKGDAGLIQ